MGDLDSGSPHKGNNLFHNSTITMNVRWGIWILVFLV